jgi:RNA polymerase sigma factor (sigma-70 family)
MKVEATVDQDFEMALIEKAKGGDPSAAPFLVSLYGEQLLGFAHAHAPDLTDADRESIVETAIEAGVRSIEKFDPARGSLFSWFRTQVRFKTLAFRRATPVRADLEDHEPSSAEPAVDLPADETNALRSALRRLSHEDQTILALRDTEQLAYSEVSHRLSITEATARQRHKRAIQRLFTEASLEPALQHYLDRGEEK